MKALFIGGTGTISTDVVELAQQRGWEITLLNRGSKKLPEGVGSIIADIHDEEAVAKAIADESYDVVAQFIAYTAEDVERDIRLFRNKTKQYIFISSASAYQAPTRPRTASRSDRPRRPGRHSGGQSRSCSRASSARPYRSDSTGG